MKKCALCGTLDESDTAQTCPMCGEATWIPVESIAKAVEEAVKSEPKRRSRR